MIEHVDPFIGTSATDLLHLHRVAAASPAAFVLPSKPRPEFVETFGIALVEEMLAGGGPLTTTDTGGISEAVGDTALIVGVEDPEAIARALDEALSLPEHEREAMELRAREHALQFDRGRVFDQLMARLAPEPTSAATLSRR